MIPFGLSKLEAYLIAGLLAATVILGGLTYVNHLRNALASAKVAVVEAKAQTTVAAGQTAAITSAAAIADQSAQRTALDITMHEDHANAIQAAAGASAPVDPALNDRGRRGLCEYASYSDDAGCAGLRVGHPAQLPQAGGADATTFVQR